MTLDSGEIGRTYTVSQVSLPLSTGRRLEALGMTEGTKITVLNSTRHGPLIIRLRGSRCASGRKIAENIRVKEETP